MKKWLLGSFIALALVGLGYAANIANNELKLAQKDIRQERAFYDCCGSSRIPVLRLHSIREVGTFSTQTPLARMTGLDRGNLIQAWLGAADMAQEDVKQPQLTPILQEFGQKTLAMLTARKISLQELEELKAILLAPDVPADHQPLLSTVQLRRLEVLHAQAGVLSTRAAETLKQFEAHAVRHGYTHPLSQAELKRPWYDAKKYPMGMLAFCLTTPREFDDSNTITTPRCLKAI